MTPVREVDILISGGGPAGLAAACAIKRATDYSLKVCEASTQYLPQGAGVLVNLNGQHALEAIDPELYRRMKAKSVSVLGSVSLSKDGKSEVYRDMKHAFGNDFMQRYGKAMFFLGWHEIRETLYESLPADVVDFGCKFDSYQEEDDGITVHFRDCSSIRTKLLIGADGYFSKVRAQLLGDGPPPFTGNIMWRARFPRPADLSTDRTRWWRDDEGRFAVIFPINNQNVTFVANAPVRFLEQRGLSFRVDRSRSVQEDATESTMDRFLTVFEDFDERLLGMVQHADSSAVTEHGLYERPVDSIPEEGWCRGGVTVIGDAAHAGLPNGQGLNLALEDGAVLGWHLREGGLTAETLQRFNSERAPRVREVLTKGLDNNTGPEKEKVIFETRFRPLRPHVTAAQASTSGLAVRGAHAQHITGVAASGPRPARRRMHAARRGMPACLKGSALLHGRSGHPPSRASAYCMRTARSSCFAV